MHDPQRPPGAGGCTGLNRPRERQMTERETETKLAELDRLLNDPDTRMDPHRVWSLLAELRATARHAEAVPSLRRV
jgi:hypothetical protein